MNLDKTDRAILQALLEDSRASQRELSRIVGVAQGTITNRLEVRIAKYYPRLLCSSRP